MKWYGVRIIHAVVILSLCLAAFSMNPEAVVEKNTSSNFNLAYEYDPPLITPHPDVTFIYGQTGVLLSWNVSDENPQMYRIWLNGVFILTNPWSLNDTVIQYDVSWLPIGKHNLSIILYDASGTTSYDDVVITVISDAFAPVIVSPSRITYVIGETGNYIAWEIFDHNPSYFEISLRGRVVYAAEWSTDYLVVEYNVDGLGVGGHLFKLTAYGIGGKSVGRALVIVHPK